jgi:hypothetical protein
MRATWSFVFGAVLAAALTGCTPSVNRGYATGNEPTGLVALTYTETGYADRFVRPRIDFRRVGETFALGSVGRDLVDPLLGAAKYLLTDERPRPDVTVTAANPSGFPAVLELPVGEYEFYMYSGTKTVPHGLGNRTTTLRSRNPFSIRFSVKPQAVTYIGNLNFDYDAAGARLSVHDHSARDLPVVQERIAEVKGKPVGIEIARSVR